MAVLGRELLTLMTPRGRSSAPPRPVIPVVALAYLLHGVFLLTSVGIGIGTARALLPDGHRRPRPPSTSAANFALIPRFGMMGAAWATVASYAVMAGAGCALSQRLYPMPFEAARMARDRAAGRRWPSPRDDGRPQSLWPALAWKAVPLLALRGGGVRGGAPAAAGEHGGLIRRDLV